PRVKLTDVTEYSSPSFRTPHGVEWLDDETIIVANRFRQGGALPLPSNGCAGGDAELTRINAPPGGDFELQSQPGSLAIVRTPGGPIEVLICENKNCTVTRHAIQDDPFRVESNDVLLRRLLELPDSVAVSTDKACIAISNSDAHVVMLYERTASLSEDSDPDCLLRGTVYPHGLQFSAD